jgi:hypothetical protein
MKCPHCSGNVPEHSRLCPNCNCDVGFPNVRAAKRPQELAALELRWKKAHEFAEEKGKEPLLSSFEAAVQTSNAVLCRSLEIANRIVSSDTIFFGTFWLEVEAGIRSPEDNVFDRARRAVDATFFPYYEKEIRFAALSLDGRGPEAYGNCSIVLKDDNIAHRASVCDENTLVFCRRRSVVVGNAPPCGFRATWDDRCRLAGAKLHGSLNDGMTTKDFPAILLRQAKATDDVEFIEVHIYGSLNRHAIKHVWVPKRVLDVPGDATPEDIIRKQENQLFVDSMRRKLKDIAMVEIYS